MPVFVTSSLKLIADTLSARITEKKTTGRYSKLGTSETRRMRHVARGGDENCRTTTQAKVVGTEHSGGTRRERRGGYTRSRLKSVRTHFLSRSGERTLLKAQLPYRLLPTLPPHRRFVRFVSVKIGGMKRCFDELCRRD